MQFWTTLSESFERLQTASTTARKKLGLKATTLTDSKVSSLKRLSAYFFHKKPNENYENDKKGLH